MVIRWLLVFILYLFIATSHAFTSVKRDFNELVNLADIVLVGNVSQITPQWRDPIAKDFIESFITFNSLEVIKGEIESETYEIKIAGGELPPYSVRIPGSPVFELNQRYVLFIKDNMQAVFPFVGVHDGIFQVDQLQDGNAVVKTMSGNIVSRIVNDEVVTTEQNSKSLTTDMMTLESFKSLIQSRVHRGATVGNVSP